MAHATRPPEGEPQIRTIAMPADANPSGDIFGGWLMAQMDLTVSNAAARRSCGRCAAVAVDGIVFHEPVFVGDEVSLYARLRRLTEETQHKVTEATFTFVAIGENRKPRLVPPNPDPG
jgi:acyl-CoA thioesterase YciA